MDKKIKNVYIYLIAIIFAGATIFAAIKESGFYLLFCLTSFIFGMIALNDSVKGRMKIFLNLLGITIYLGFFFFVTRISLVNFWQ